MALTSTLKKFTLRLPMEPITPKEQKPKNPTSSLSSTEEKFVSKGSAWPADFSQDQPEYQDKELELELAKAEQELRAKTGIVSAPEEEPETEADGERLGQLRLLKVRQQSQALTGRTPDWLPLPKTTPEALESSFDASPNTPK
jgi:hypothetical protein